VTARLSGTFARRPFVLQRNESDFAFVSRLMEEEGIFYFFGHDEGGHTLVLGNTPAAHDHLDSVDFDGDGQLKRGEVVFDWEKTQELVAGKVTLWDHCFELPHNHLEATKVLPDLVQTEATRGLEVFDFPGGYAQQFDGVDPGGGERPAELQKLFPAATRAAGLRAEELAAGAIEIEGASSVRRLTAGATVQLEKRFDGKYLITSCTHRASRFGDRIRYDNSFTCIPDAVPFRPARTTPKPELGLETAFVVGPAGEEVFADKYARIKVQFHWDRAGTKDQNSSTWIRVSHPHALENVPEVGDEVIVAFLHGDPDQPIVLGSVWNAADMPPRETSTG
jgi:type VI secretion system secreted protein VgrG